MTVYKIVCNGNGKMYIGMTGNFDERRVNHLAYLRNNHHKVAAMQDDFNKYGESAFDIVVVKDKLKYKTAAKLEEALIETLKPTGSIYNIRIGSKIDLDDPIETERIIKAVATQQSEEYRKSVSNRMKKLAKDPAWRKRNSESKRGRVFSKEHKIKLSEAHLTKEYKENMGGANHPRARKIYCRETNKTYGTLVEAAKDTGMEKANVCLIASGKTKHPRKYTFEYVRN